MDIADIYYTPNVTEAIDLMKSRSATHVYISDRLINRGWLPITSHSRWKSYSIGSGMKKINVRKFEYSDCFEKIEIPNDVGTRDRVSLFELVC